MAGLAGVLVTCELRHLRLLYRIYYRHQSLHRRGAGRIGSLPGAMLGGLLLGWPAQFAGLVNSDYKDVFSFALLVAILIFDRRGCWDVRWWPRSKEALWVKLRQPARAIQNALIDSVLAGLCALIVFGPIVGVVPKGHGFTSRPARVAILVAVVMAGRLALSLLLQSHRGKAFIAALRGADDGVIRPAAGLPLRLRWIIPLLVGLAIVFPFSPQNIC